MKGELYIVGGIKGLQAVSTGVVTAALHRRLREIGWTCRLLVLEPRRVPRGRATRWIAEAFYRHLAYPVWCRRRVPAGSLVYVTDHANAGVLPWLRGCGRTVVHVHDLTSMRPPWDFPFPLRLRNLMIWFLGLATKRIGIMRAGRLVAISRFTADEIVRYLGVERERIVVVPNGIDHETYRPMDRSDARRDANLPDDAFVVMTVGPASYRKNTLVVADALARSRGDLEPLRWVHVGALDDRTSKALRSTRLLDRVSVVSGLCDAEMRSLYCAASVFVHPSLYEGFGLPPVEALACGVPVVASDIPASREVLGPAARYFPASSPAELGSALVSVKRDEGRIDVADLTRCAAKYDWRSAAAAVDRLLGTLSDKSF